MRSHSRMTIWIGVQYLLKFYKSSKCGVNNVFIESRANESIKFLNIEKLET